MDIETIFWCGILDLACIGLLSSSLITYVIFRMMGVQKGEK